MTINRDRRRLLTGLAGLLAVPSAVGARLEPTPRQTAGPFYPDEPPLEDDNDLVHVAGQPHPALGRIADVRGRVLDTAGRPLRGLRVDIWQCDANGRYHHAGDYGQELDPGFQGFGRTVTDERGRYRFRTIRPVPYSGRTPHIHFAVDQGDGNAFTTQLYIRGEPRNEGDFLFRRIPESERDRVTAVFEPSRSPDAELQARYDIVLGATPQA